MDLALGVAISATSVRLALVDVADEDGRTIDCDEFALPLAGNIASPSTSESLVTAILGTQAIAAAGGHSLASIGLSWQDERESDAATVMETLTDLGFRNLTAVSALESADALAARIAGATKFDTVAVCIIEPEAVFQCVLQTGDALEAHSRTLDGGEAADVASRLAAGLNTTPNAFVVLGSDPATDSIAQSLAAVVTCPVITTPRRELALARGAAFAAARPSGSLGGVTAAETPAPAVFVTRTTRLAAMSELLEPVEMPAPTRSRLNVGSITSVLVAAVTVFAVAGFMLITGDADQGPVKVERRQVVETLVNSAKPVPAVLPPVQEQPAPPPLVEAAPPPPVVVQPAPRQRIAQVPATTTQWSAPQPAAVPPPINPGFDAAVQAIQDWWLAQQPQLPPPPPEDPEPMPGFQPFNPFAPPA